jgi:hypothetical protein
MDILNFISWIKGRRQVTSVDATKTLLPVGLKDPRRDDEYLAGAISVEDFITQVGGVQSVTDDGLGSVFVNNIDPLNPIISFTGINVDGTTITGDGTVGNPLVASAAVGPIGPIGPQGIQGIQGLVGPTGAQGVAGPVGAAGLNFVGAFDNTIGYLIDDVVFFGGSSYVAVINIPAPTPPTVLPNPNVDTVNWNFLAIQGLTGPQGPQGIPGPASFVHYIGEPYDGGIIVDVWKDNLGVEHGLIMSYVNIPIKVWSNVAIIGATSVTDGLANSNTIVAQAGHTTSMALDCLNYTNINYGTGVYTDWYLPSIGEMMCVVKNRVIIDSAIAALGGAVGLLGAQYWTSTSTGINSAMMSSQATLILGSINKINPQPGRPFRKF